jgi:hypothetical protein
MVAGGNMYQVERLTGQQKVVLGCAAGLVILVLVMNIFLIGGVNLVQELDALIPCPLALLISVLLFRLWWASKKDEIGRKIWGTFLIGSFLWFIAEGIWNVYSLLGLELPFPSLADIPWFIGYFFFFWALYQRFRSLGASLHKKEIIWLSLLYSPLVILTLIYSILPVILEGGMGIFAAALSIFYPLADLIIPLRSIIVMIVLRKGSLIRPWALIGASFLCLSIADLAFSYAEGKGIYWPGGVPNFISVFGDWLYIVAYVVMGLGVYFVPMVFNLANHAVTNETQVISLEPQTVGAPIPESKKSAFLFMDARGKIFYISLGAIELFGLRTGGDYLNVGISKLLMKSEDEISDMLRKINRTGMLEKQDILISPSDPAQRLPLKISAVANRDTGGKFIGADMFFYPIEATDATILDHASGVKELTEEEERQQLQSERDEDLFRYFHSQVKVIYILIARYAGIAIANKVVYLFNESAVKNEWPIQLDPVSLDVTDKVSGTTEERAHIYRYLLHEIFDYAVAIASYSNTVRELQILDRSISAELRESSLRFGLRFPYTSPDVH